MPTTDAYKRLVPLDSDSADGPLLARNLSMTTHAFIPVSTEAEMKTVAANADRQAFPLFFDVASSEMQYRVGSPTAEPRWISGASPIWDGGMSNPGITRSTWTKLRFEAARAGRQSGNWSLNATSDALTLPASGVWVMQARMVLGKKEGGSVTTSEVPRLLMEVQVGANGYRVTARNEQVITATYQKYAEKGDAVSVSVWHDAAMDLRVTQADMCLSMLGTI
ncbi:hypothetical protein [Actinotignum sp. GS-2025b]